MSRKIYFVRHGKPNIEGDRKRCIGLTDYPLSDLGKKQAEKIGTWLVGQKIQKIYTSPLSRCRETAGIIKEASVASSAIQVREELHEIAVGIWENLTFDEIKERYPEEYRMRGENIGSYAPPEGESFCEAGKRFVACVNEIRKESRGNVLIVAHAGVIRSYLCSILNLSADEVMRFPQPYTGVTIVEEAADGWTLNVSKIGWKPYSLLDQEDIRQMYKECKTPEKVIRHMDAVADFLEKLKYQMEEEQRSLYDWELLKKAALLHDVKRAEKNHAAVSADYIRKQGYEEIAQLVRYHHDGTLSSGGFTEEEILFYADKRVQEDKVVSLEERFAGSKKKCLVPEALEKHRRLYEKAKKIEYKVTKDEYDKALAILNR